MFDRSLLSLLGLGAFALTVSGCSLISTEVETDVKVQGVINGMDTEVFDHHIQDLLEIDDYKNNIDKIKQGRVTKFVIKFTNVYDDNMAQRVGGRVNVRLANTMDPFIEGVAQWTPVYLSANDDEACAANAEACRLNEIEVIPDPATSQQLNDILFSEDPKPVEFQIQGFANEAPVHFDYEVQVFIELEVGA